MVTESPEMKYSEIYLSDQCIIMVTKEWKMQE